VRPLDRLLGLVDEGSLGVEEADLDDVRDVLP